VTPGTQAVVAVHDPGLPPAERGQWLQSAQQSWAAWVYPQRGHAPSGWARGGVYRTSDFAIDLVRLLSDVIDEPCLLVGQGAGGLVAMLAAAAAPQLVTGLHLLAGNNASAWGADLARVINEDDGPNQSWLTAVRSAAAPASCDRDDPLLDCGPAEKMSPAAVRAAAAQVRVPWSVPRGHFLEPHLPAAKRAAAPLLAPLSAEQLKHGPA
jgi:pimeloyl-ACP methyl ester carboxylesterase